ncbi:MAG: ATP-binding cassette domain-containing protein [Bacillota bacterium]
MLAVETHGLTKIYGGKMVVDHLNLEVPEGSVFGFLGPNGAGKTTTIRMLMGLAHPSFGAVRVLGGPAAEGRRFHRVGFLPDVPNFYGWMNAREFLAFAGGLFKIPRRELRPRIDELLKLTGLDGIRTRIGRFSRGMKQRLGLAQAMINRPALLIMDEPTSALDPVGRKEVLEVIRRLGTGATVLFSTHILADVERVCDHMAILNKGTLLKQGPISRIRSEYARKELVLTVAAQHETVIRQINASPWVKKTTVDGGRIRIIPYNLETARNAIPGLLAQAGAGLIEFKTEEPTLEDIFVKLVNR